MISFASNKETTQRRPTFAEDSNSHMLTDESHPSSTITFCANRVITTDACARGAQPDTVCTGTRFLTDVSGRGGRSWSQKREMRVC